MPNLVVTRYFITGPKEALSLFKKKYLRKQKGNLVLLDYFADTGSDWNLDWDQLEYSGEIIDSPTLFAFSSYEGWTSNMKMHQKMASNLPQGTVLKVVGYDSNDDLDLPKGFIEIYEGNTGDMIENSKHKSIEIAQEYFPLFLQKQIEANESD